MKRTNIIYWILTGLLALLMAFSGIASFISGPQSSELFKHLGYPEYLITFLGIAKVLGAIVVVIPGFPRLKEWAYAGFTFDLAGAMYSYIRVGDPFSSWAMLLIGFALIFSSYIFFHKRQKAVA